MSCDEDTPVAIIRGRHARRVGHEIMKTETVIIKDDRQKIKESIIIILHLDYLLFASKNLTK